MKKGESLSASVTTGSSSGPQAGGGGTTGLWTNQPQRVTEQGGGPHLWGLSSFELMERPWVHPGRAFRQTQSETSGHLEIQPLPSLAWQDSSQSYVSRELNHICLFSIIYFV